MGQRFAVVAFVVALLLGALALPATAAPERQAATDTPVPAATATPVYQVEHVLSSGAVMLEERSWTWGQVALVGGLLLLVAVTLLEMVWRTFLWLG